MFCIALILLVAVLPGVLAEDYTDLVYKEINVSLLPYEGVGNYTANYANTSTILKNADTWGNMNLRGSYVGAYEIENLVQFDYLPPTFDSNSINPSDPEDYFTSNINVMFQVSSIIQFTNKQILSGASHFWVRVPIACRAIADRDRGAGVDDAWMILQITDMQTNKISHIFMDGKTDRSIQANYTINDDRLYIECNKLILPEVPYRFDFFSPLQTMEPNYTVNPRDLGAVKPSVYLSGEDIFNVGIGAELRGGVLRYDDDTCQFYCDIDYPGYGGFYYNVSLDAGWSFYFLEGVGEGMYGREIETKPNSAIDMFMSIEPSNENKHVSLYFPIICSEVVEYNVEMWRLNYSVNESNHMSTLSMNTTSGQWVKDDGSPAVKDYYWDSDDDCDGDGYNDYPNLTGRDFLAVTTTTNIIPYGYKECGLWFLRIIFEGYYNITLLCYDDDNLVYLGNATNINRTTRWMFRYDSGEGWTNYNDNIWFYAFLTDGYFVQQSCNSTWFDIFGYPHIYRYNDAYNYGSKIIYVNVSGNTHEVEVWNETNPPTGISSLLSSISWATFGELLTANMEGDSVAGIIYDAFSMVSSGLQWVGTKIYEGVKWIGEKFQEGMTYLYRGLVSFVDAVLVAINAVINFLSFLIEFGIVILSLVVFLGAIVLYNKLLMVIRDALYKLFSGINKTYLMIGGEQV